MKLNKSLKKYLLINTGKKLIKLNKRNKTLPIHIQSPGCQAGACRVCNRFAYKQGQINKLETRFNDLMHLNAVTAESLASDDDKNSLFKEIIK